MDFRLNDEQRMMIETARQIGEGFGLEYWRKHDADKAFPKAYWKAVCDAGLAGVALPEEHGGSGLGMHIVYNLVNQQLHGRVSLQTEPEQGCRFTLRLPIHTAAQAESVRKTILAKDD